jgi:hypothetical protein
MSILKKAEDLAVKIHKAPKDYDEATLPRLDEIKESIPCGSALLCSGTAAESRLIEEVDRTDFSHTAMIVKFHDDNLLYLWTADTVDQLDDQIDKISDKKHPGTHLLVLRDYLSKLDELYPSPDGSKYRFAVARLSGVTVDEKKLWSVMFEYDGTPFPPTKQEFIHWIEGQVDIDSGMTNSFCAQMLANTYQKMGWLTTEHPPNHYNPGSFAKTEMINKQLIGGAKLAEPQYFKL